MYFTSVVLCETKLDFLKQIFACVCIYMNVMISDISRALQQTPV